MIRILIVVAVVILLGPIALLLLLSTTPKIDLDPALSSIGTSTPVKVHIADSHGVRNVSAWVEQNGSRYPVFTDSRPATRLLFFKGRKPEDVTFSAGTKNAPSLKDGRARFIVSATSNDLRGSTGTADREVNVITRPPRVVADGAQHYINQGGCELVTYAVEGFATESGEMSGKYKFRSFQMPGKPPNQRFSLFGYPWDLPANTVPVVYATNPAGNMATAHFWFKVFPKSFRKRDLEINDSFLEKVVNDIDPGGSGDLLSRFLKINGEMRKQNNQTLADMREKTADHFFWTGPFLRMNAKAESNFADDRSYIYHGKKVDEQVHLGFDLSDVRHSKIPAANDGKVVYADRLGIYGNCIVLDHGYGLQTIYGHLSQIQVKVGDMVKKGQQMGLSGDTGLAGGDHLHFSMQVDGVQVNPIEWWDEHWIHDRIFSKVGATQQ